MLYPNDYDPEVVARLERHYQTTTVSLEELEGDDQPLSFTGGNTYADIIAAWSDNDEGELA